MKNTKENYGWLTIVLHWSVATLVIALFVLGYWMVDLGYYHAWYKQGPDLHKSIGIILFMLMIARVIVRLTSIQPISVTTHSSSEKALASLAHKLLFMIVFIVMCSGYLISTADGRAIEIFGFISIPSLGELFANQEDLAGVIHKYCAYFLIFTVLLHALAALKHHFIDKDNTLLRMLGHKENSTI